MRCAAKSPISYLTDPEVDALLQAPPITRWAGRRDRLIILAWSPRACASPN